MALAFMLFVPVAIAADGTELPHTGRVLISVQGDATLPAGEQADVVVVVQGDATIDGVVNTLVVVDGTATLTGATVETMVVVRGSAMLHEGTHILGDVRTFDASVQNMGATIDGQVTGMERDFVNVGLVLTPLFFLFWLGLAVSSLLAGLVLVALGTRQVRQTETLVRNELGMTLLFGLGGLILLPLIAILFMITIVGLPFGFALLLFVWPLVAFLGYMFAGVMLGEWITIRLFNQPPAERPYLAAIVGLIALQLVSIVPFVGAIASWIGMGAVLLLAWRTARGTPRPAVPVPTSWGTAPPHPIG
jgi:hypothetical protein